MNEKLYHGPIIQIDHVNILVYFFSSLSVCVCMQECKIWHYTLQSCFFVKWCTVDMSPWPILPEHLFKKKKEKNVQLLHGYGSSLFVAYLPRFKSSNIKLILIRASTYWALWKKQIQIQFLLNDQTR